MLALNRPISPARILLLAAALLVAAVGAAGAANVSFDLEPLGSTWGGSVGNVPGDLAFTEDGIPMTVDEFHLGAFTGFNYCRIEPAIPAFGSGQILRLNNIATVFDFSAVPCAPGTVRFDFADQGGDENLRVNGGPLYEIGDFTAVDGVTVAPGVLCSVVASVVGGSLVGTVTLTGPVTKLLVGGQELYIDNVRMDCEEPCDFRVTHDFEPLGSCWGSAFGQAPGDLAFTEDGIPVTLDLYDYGAGTFFTAACIVNTFCGMGDAQAFQLDNIDAVYQIHALGITTSEVSFEFIDTGGTENLQVNGGPLYIGEISAAPAAIAPGVTCSVVTFPCNGNIRGIVTLTGEGLLQLVLVLFISFFIYRDGTALAERLSNGSRKLAGDLGVHMLSLSRGTVMGVMAGIVGTAAAQAFVALVGFLIAGVPGAMLLAAAIFFLSMIPVGPPLIWGGAAYWLYDQGQTGWAIFMVIWGMAVISSIDNFVKPLLISRTASLPILLIALGVFGGVLAFGFIGIFIGPVLLALGLVLANEWTSSLREMAARE